ncbi:class III signal peptide-containing protein [Methanobacterium oryzae]|uniref:class III signal peptide-containing protein n=1 Tax=Methanobacterium oryzae TaxID=69540 RepID=UPI003D202B6A
MKFLSDERGQGAAEYILLFGGVIVIAIAALVIYNSYFTTQSSFTDQDLQTVRSKTSTNDRSL